MKNWAKNIDFRSERYHHPSNLKDLCSIVKNSSHIRVQGSTHSFNEIAVTDFDTIILDEFELDIPVFINALEKSCWFPGRWTYGQAVEFLKDTKFALHNLASLPHITIAGSITTATHGSGINNGNLASCVIGLEIVNAQGELVVYSRESHPEEFDGIVVSLGVFGVITRVNIQLIETFKMRQDIYESLTLEMLKDNFDEIVASGYSVSLFTTWENREFEQVWRKSKLNDKGELLGEMPDVFFGATKALDKVHPCTKKEGVERCTDQLGVSGHWHNMLPHFKLEFMPSFGEELQSEFFVDRKHAYEALEAVNTLKDEISPILYICEVRTIKRDNLWLSMTYGRESVAIHFTWKAENEKVSNLLPKLEGVLSPFDHRPHWGKVSCTHKESELKLKYPKWEEFKTLRSKLDPENKFVNDFVKKVFDL